MDALHEIVSRKFSPSEEHVLRKKYTNKKTSETTTVALTYVQVPAIIDRLNEAFGVTGWTFETEVFFEPAKPANELVLSGRLVHLASGCYKVAFGSDTINEASGDEAYANALKGAYGDALRLCAKQFGIGAYLWMKGSDTPAASDEPSTPATAGKPNKYKGPCGRCGQEVAAEAGYSQKVGDKWIVFHHECPTPTAPTPEPTPAQPKAPQAPAGATKGTTVTQGSEMYPCSPAQYGFLLACLKRTDLTPQLVEQAAFLVDNPTITLIAADQKQYADKGYTTVASVPNKLEANNLIAAIKAHLEAPKPSEAEDELPF